MGDQEERGPNHIKNYELGPMQPYGNYPQSLLDTFRVKSLLSPNAHLKTEDAHAGPARDCPGHRLRCSHSRLARGLFHHQGDRGLRLGRGLVHRRARHHDLRGPFTSHAMVITSEEPLLTLIFSWAPGGDRSVFEEDGKLI